MAIIKYTLVNGQTPSGITDGGWFLNSADNTLIGIGSGVGIELTKAELITRMQEIGGRYMELNHGIEDVSTLRYKTDSEIESEVNAWCSVRGI